MTAGSPTVSGTPSRVLGAAAIAVGAGMGFIVGRDGTPAWQLARVAATALLTGLVYVGVRKGGRVRRSSVAMTAGAVACAVGVGFGVPHLAKTGTSVEAIAGIVVLVGGLVLFAGGAALIGRSPLGWRRWPLILAASVGLLLLVLVLGQAVAATNVPRTALGSDTPADRGLAYRDVSFHTRDGVRLSGWYVPTTNGAAVALIHGAGSTRSSVLDHAVVLARHGYGVLLFDARGHGRSAGRAMNFGWHGDEDVGAAVSFLQRAAGVDTHRIAAVGMSMGGEEAIGAMAADARLAGVVAEGATNRVPADKGWLANEFGWRGRVQQGLEWLVYNTADLLTSTEQPIGLRAAAATAAPRPVLLIAAGANPDEAHAARFIERGSPGTVQIWIAPEAEHTGALAAHPDQWEARVTRFLETVLASGAPASRLFRPSQADPNAFIPSPAASTAHPCDGAFGS